MVGGDDAGLVVHARARDGGYSGSTGPTATRRLFAGHSDPCSSTNSRRIVVVEGLGRGAGSRSCETRAVKTGTRENKPVRPPNDHVPGLLMSADAGKQHTSERAGRQGEEDANCQPNTSSVALQMAMHRRALAECSPSIN